MKENTNKKLTKTPKFWGAIIFGLLCVYITIGALYGTSENSWVLPSEQIIYGAIPSGVISIVLTFLTFKSRRP